MPVNYLLGKLATGCKCLWISSGLAARTKRCSWSVLFWNTFSHKVAPEINLVHVLKNNSIVKARVQEVGMTSGNTFFTSAKSSMHLYWFKSFKY